MDIPEQEEPTPLRVGILVDSLKQPRWIEKIVSGIIGSPVGHLVVVICNSTPEEPEAPFVERLWQRRSHLLYSMYQRFDRKLFAPKIDAFAESDLSSLIADVPRLDVLPVRKGIGNYFSAEDIQRVESYHLDVMVRFGFGILRGEILAAARFGVWSHHHGDVNTRRGGPAGFWEVMEGTPTTGSMLQRLNNTIDNGLVLYKSQSRTADWSVLQNVNSMYWKTAEFVGRTLIEVARNPSHISDLEASREYEPYDRRLYRAPTNKETAACGARLLGRYAMAKARSMVTIDQWALAFKIDQHAQRPADTFSGFVQLIPPKDRFWADPFPIRVDGKYYIFFEELPYSTGKGHLCAIPVDAKGACGEAFKVLETDCHLSYPFLFEWEGNLYMMPETGNRKTVEVYRCERFPDVWRLDRVVMRGMHVVDSTLHFEDGIWWLFANIAGDGSSKHDELHLFSGDSPFGPWYPHPMNPIRSDVRFARPAGKLFRYNHRLYRPAQDLSRSGAFAVTINIVDHLSTRDYRERAAYRFQPQLTRKQLGAHTLNFADGLTVIDLMLRR